MPKDAWAKARARAIHGPVRPVKASHSRKYRKPSPDAIQVPYKGFVVLATEKAIAVARHQAATPSIWIPLSQLKGIDYNSHQTSGFKPGPITGFQVTPWWSKQNIKVRRILKARNRRSIAPNGQRSGPPDSTHPYGGESQPGARTERDLEGTCPPGQRSSTC